MTQSSWYQVIILFCLLIVINSLVPPFANAQDSINSSEDTIKVLLSNASSSLESGDANKAVQDLLTIQRLLALSNDSSSNQDSRLLVRETIGALLNNRPDIAAMNLESIDQQLFPPQLSQPPENITLEVPNISQEKPQLTTIPNATNNMTSLNVNADVSNRTLENPNVTTQMTLNNNETAETKINDPAKIKFLNFSNPIFGIKIKYPDTWSARVYSYNNEGNNTIVGFYSPSKTASQLGNISGVSGQFVPYLDIFVFDSNNISLEKIIDGRMNRLQNTTDIVIESKPFTLGDNHEAHKLVYSTITGGDEFFKKMQVYTIYNNKVYLITFTAQETLFSNYIPLVESMIDTFEISGIGF